MSVLSPGRPAEIRRGPARPRPTTLGHRTGFPVVAAAFLVSMAFSAAPTPLWGVYQRYEHFSTFTVTVAFAVYALGVVVSLFLAGHLSDRLGRRRILLPAVLLEAVSAAVFLSSASLPAVIAARLVSGLGVGMITATATAYLAELHLAARPGASRARADLAATAANLGGLAVGPLVSGLLAQYASRPLHTPYLVFLGLLLLSAAGLAFVPETVEAAGERTPYRPQRISVPGASRGTYFAASAAAFAAFSVLGLFTSVAPGFVSDALHHPSRALAGLVAFLVFGAAAAAQPALARVTAGRRLAAGLLLMTLGVGGVIAGVRSAHFPLFLASGVAAGAGAGTLFQGAVTTVAALAPARARGEALAGLFLAAYAGLALPILGIGAATRFVTAETALLGFGTALLALAAAIAAHFARARHGAGPNGR
ncbi:MFS transporter [Actinocorallia populi]|uniref:MFS transporter n=1 Tax=Actinocorallia populi TaxID=2079200 RepID=UPI000D08C875|nr:MFS transporter [Actinocorallia populi]